MNTENGRCKMKKYLTIITFLITGCGSAVDPEPVAHQSPEGCEVKEEYIRVQLCPSQDLVVVCMNHLQTNIAPGYCDGPDWTSGPDGHQVTGNAWCCSDSANFYSQETVGK
jgi:hypothetical protein